MAADAPAEAGPPAATAPEAAAPLADDAPHLLVVDDDRRIRDLLARYLLERGYRVTAAGNAAEARAKLEHLVFDLIVLDVMMPGDSGFVFAREVRARSDVPIVMLTARADASDRILGLEIGADDYVPKPFDPRELVLRLGNVLKRGQPPAGEPDPAPAARFGPFTFRLDRGELRRGDAIVKLTEREREMLATLVRAEGATVPREAFAAGAGGEAEEDGERTLNERTVDVQINRLRRKLEADPANPLHLQTVRGAGYRLVRDA